MMHQLRDIFAEQGANRGHRASEGLDARIKLIASLAAVLAVVLSSSVTLPLAVMGASLAGAVAAGISARRLLGRMIGPVTIAAFVFLLKAMLTGSTSWVSLPLGQWRLTMTREGALAGILVASRVLGAVSAVMLLCMATPSHAIFAALRWARMPRSWVEIAMLMHRYIFTLFEQAADVQAAQRTRLGYRTWRRSMRSMAGLMGIVVLRSIDQADRTHDAMVARGFGGSIPMMAMAPLPRRQLAVLGAAVAALAGAFAAAQRWCP